MSEHRGINLGEAALRDDRGAKHSTAPLARFFARRRNHELLDELIAAVHAAGKPVPLRTSFVRIIAPALIIGIVGAALVVIRQIVAGPSNKLMAAFLGAALLTLYFWLQNVLKKRSRSAAIPELVATSFRATTNVFIGHGVCPCCAYPLAGLESEADGCVVCPECGGAWAIERRRRLVEDHAAAEQGVCAGCSHKTAGLPWQADATIECPNCGKRTHQPLPDDIVESDTDAVAAYVVKRAWDRGECRACGGAIAGVRWSDAGTLTCPRCRAVYQMPDGRLVGGGTAPRDESQN